MFDLAQQNKIALSLRNDFLGHWYDAKKQVSHHFSDLKTTLNLRKQMAQVQFKIKENDASITDFTLRAPVASNNDQNATKYKLQAEKRSQKLKKIVLALKIKDQALKDANSKTIQLLNDLSRSVDEQLYTKTSCSQMLKKNNLIIGPASGSNQQVQAQRNASPLGPQMKNYQQSSLQRSTTTTALQRVNSRGKYHQKTLSQERRDATSAGKHCRNAARKGTFYEDHDTDTAEKPSDLKFIRNKLEKYLAAQECAKLAYRSRDRFENELLKQLDLYLGEQSIYFGHGMPKVDMSLQKQQQEQNQNALDELRELVNQERSSFFQGLVGTPSISDYNNQNNLLSAATKQRSSNTLISSKEPRHFEPIADIQAVDHRSDLQQQYLYESEETKSESMTQVNNKVRSQKVQEMQDSNDQLFNELRKANEKYLDVRVENNKLKDSVQQMKLSLDQMRSEKTNSAASRQRPMSSSGGGTYTAASRKRTEPNNNTIQADTELRKQHDILKIETLQVCNKVKAFMAAMRTLQKAVSRKEVDMSNQKRGFDNSKRELEDSVEQSLNKLQMQVPEVQQMTTSVKVKSVSQMQRDISAQRFGQRPASVQAAVGSTKRSSVPPSRQRGDDDQNLNLLQKQVRSLQLEKDKMRELIEELKQTNKIYASDRDVLNEKLKAKGIQLHKFASQCQVNASRANMLENVLSDHKNAVDQLGANERVKAELKAKEEQQKAKYDAEVRRIFVNLKIDPQFVALRDELTSQVELKEKHLDQQFAQLTFRLTEKEDDLKRLKLLFVQKLRELETSFVEISHEVDETDRVTQDVTAKRKQEFQTLLEKKPLNGQNHLLDRSMEEILSNYDNEETQGQMEELIQANTELLEQNEKLKKQLADKDVEDDATDVLGGGGGAKKQNMNSTMHAEMVIELNDQIDEIKQDCDRLRMNLKLAGASEGMSKKEIQGLKYDNKRMVMDLKDNKDRFEKVKQEYQQQFNMLKQTSVAMKQQLQKEYDARTTNETKYLAAQKQLKIARQENQEQQTEMLLLMKRIEDLHAEQAYLKELRDTDSEDDTADELPEPQKSDKNEEKKDSDEEESKEEGDRATPPEKDMKKHRAELKEEEQLQELEERVAADPQDAARYYHRVANVTKQEFKSMKKRHAKQASAEASEHILNSKLQDLEKEKVDLQQQIAKNSKGTRLVICLQNYVRKMVQEKLEQAAVELEALGAKNKEAAAEAAGAREKVAKLEKDYQETITGHETQMEDLEQNISTVRKQLEDAEKQKQAIREEALRAKEQEQKIAQELVEARSPDKKTALPSSEAGAASTDDSLVCGDTLRKQITDELEENFRKQQQEVVQKYKRIASQANEKHSEAVAELTEKLATAAVVAGSSDMVEQIDKVKQSMQTEREVALKKLKEMNEVDMKKSRKTTLLMICLQNRVREMVDAKLTSALSSIQDKENANMSLRENVLDVSTQHNKKVVEMREEYEKQKQEETAAIIAKHEAQMAQFEAKMRQEQSDYTAKQDEAELSLLSTKLIEQQAAFEKETSRTRKHTRIMICMMEFVRKILRGKLDQHETDLKLARVQIDKLVGVEIDFKKYKEDKSRELEELNTQNKDESANKVGQIDAADAQIQSLKSVQEALEREKDDLLIQNEGIEEELHSARTELIEIKGLNEFKDMRIEELEERVIEVEQTAGMNKAPSELGSSGKVIHQGDDLRELEMGSDGYSANNSNRESVNSAGEETKTATAATSDHANLDTLKTENAELREQVDKLRQDLDQSIAAMGSGRNSWEGTSQGRGSWGSDQLSRNPGVEEHLKHVRAVMTQFLSKLPVTSKENEDVLPVVFSMLNFPQEEMDAITEARAKLIDQNQGKKGIFGGRNKNNKKRK